MKVLIVLVSLITLTFGQSPYAKGPYESLNFHWGFGETGLYKNVEVYAPKNATGSFPVIYFSHSFAGTITVKSVDTFLAHLASWGYTVIAPWRQISANYTVEWIDPTIDYAQENARIYIEAAGGLGGYYPDFNKMIAVGHSAGNHILVNYLKRIGCRSFQAAVHLSPVDGTDPFGIIQTEFCITPGEKVNYEIPTLVVMAGLDPIPGQLLYPPCAPANLSNTRFYDAMSGNRWFINASQYGHADFFEPGFVDLVEFLNFCASDDETDKEIYTSFVGGTVVAFIEGLLESTKCSSMLKYIEDPTFAPVDVISLKDVNNSTRCNSGCSWKPQPTTPPSTTSGITRDTY